MRACTITVIYALWIPAVRIGACMHVCVLGKKRGLEKSLKILLQISTIGDMKQLSEKKEKREVKSETEKHVALDRDRADVWEKLMVVAKPAGVEPPTPQPKPKKDKKEQQE